MRLSFKTKWDGQSSSAEGCEVEPTFAKSSHDFFLWRRKPKPVRWRYRFPFFLLVSARTAGASCWDWCKWDSMPFTLGLSQPSSTTRCAPKEKEDDHCIFSFPFFHLPNNPVFNFSIFHISNFPSFHLIFPIFQFSKLPDLPPRAAGKTNSLHKQK